MSSYRRSSLWRSVQAGVAATGPFLLLVTPVTAQSVPNSPAERAITQTAMAAIVKAGIDLRTTPVRVVTTADRMVYVTGPVDNQQAVKAAVTAAAGAVPGYRVVTDIRFSTSDDSNHARSRTTK